MVSDIVGTIQDSAIFEQRARRVAEMRNLYWPRYVCYSHPAYGATEVGAGIRACRVNPCAVGGKRDVHRPALEFGGTRQSSAHYGLSGSSCPTRRMETFAGLGSTSTQRYLIRRSRYELRQNTREGMNHSARKIGCEVVCETENDGPVTQEHLGSGRPLLPADDIGRQPARAAPPGPLDTPRAREACVR